MAAEGAPDPFEDLMPPGAPPPPPEVNEGTQKTWEELRQSVKKTRKLAHSLLYRVPTSFTFRHIETEFGLQTRIYFLGMPLGSRENSLLYADLPLELRPESELQEPLEWKQLLDSFHATPMYGQFSKEEQLLRERKRLGSFGITSYDYNDEIGKFVFPACSSLFLCTDTLVEGNYVDQPAFPTEVRSSSLGTRLDPKLCPQNPN